MKRYIVTRNNASSRLVGHTKYGIFSKKFKVKRQFMFKQSCLSYYNNFRYYEGSDDLLSWSNKILEVSVNDECFIFYYKPNRKGKTISLKCVYECGENSQWFTICGNIDMDTSVYMELDFINGIVSTAQPTINNEWVKHTFQIHPKKKSINLYKVVTYE